MKQVSKKEAKSLMLVNSMNKYCKNIIYKKINFYKKFKYQKKIKLQVIYQKYISEKPNIEQR